MSLNNKIIYPNKNIQTYSPPLTSQNQHPSLIHQKSFASIRQFVLSNNHFKQQKEEQNQKFPRFSSIRRRKKILDEENSNKNGKIKRIPSVRKVGVCHGKNNNLDWRSKSVAGLKSTNTASNKNPIAEQRKYSLTLISQKAKKSMQRKLSELAKNDSNFVTQTIGRIVHQQTSLDKQQNYENKSG
uniref:Uncharacterized protein n=1 Tax=Meloidogyne floridensis TaxID=298350 RepID=A0A915P2Z2_9BILA